MIDGDEISDVKLIRLLRSFGSVGAEEPGTLSPDPWHFSLWANSMRRRMGDVLFALPITLIARTRCVVHFLPDLNVARDCQVLCSRCLL